MRIKSLLGLIILFLFETSPLLAQQLRTFRVTDFHRDALALTARNEQYKKTDDSGSLYAIIKVKSDLPDDDLQSYRFDFGLMNSIVVHHPETEELWVYVQKNAKTVTISREGFVSVNKYDLQTTIEAGTTYVMQLSVSAPQIYLQMVMFRIQPATAKAFIMVKSESDEQEEVFGAVDETGSVAKSLPLGNYTYRVAAENFYPSEGRLTLNRQNETHIEEVTLRSNVGMITLQVDTDAEIYVDGEKKGTRSWSGSLKSGQHRVECRQANHKTSVQAITIKENETRTFTLTPPTPITGTLSITSRPLGADITIDGKSYGQTPKMIDNLLIGQHTATLSKSQYAAEKKAFEIRENQTTQLDITLKQNKSEVQKPKPEKKEKKPAIANSSAYQKPTCFYGMVGTQVGTLMAANATVGAYFNQMNIEASFLYGLSFSDDIYWLDSTNTGYYCDYRAWGFGGKFGYGFNLLNDRLRLTPQVGVTLLNIHSDDMFYDTTPSTETSSGYALSATVGARADYAITRSFGVYLAPEIDFAVTKSDVFSQIADVSNEISNWANGFNVRLGFRLSF